MSRKSACDRHVHFTVFRQKKICYNYITERKGDWTHIRKKLQVFVSSTYLDLIEERQAAVEAILDAGHISASMGLFKAGNESQLKTIYQWIDESDVYMLILGGRYGTVEPKSGKSYTQLEYACSKKIPVFAILLSETLITLKKHNRTRAS